MLEVEQKDINALSTLINTNGLENPDVKISVWKNRRTKWKNILVWCKKDLGKCKMLPLFVTDYNYNLIDIENLKIEIKDELEDKPPWE